MSADKYRQEEPESQVRSIIRQLNEDRPSKEKSREIVVRPDGTKVVRVIKKRKVTVSSVQRNRHAKRRFLLLLLFLLLVGIALAGIVSVRMSSMASDSYIKDRQQELCESWGATSVHCEGARISGFSLTIGSMVVEFPESSIVERMELRNLSSALATTSFFRGIPESDELKIESAVVRLREGVTRFTMPRQSGKELWKFKRISCSRLSCFIGDEATSAVSLKQSSAYMYYPASSRSSRVLILNNGVLQLKGWKPIVVSDAKMHFGDNSVEDIHISGSLDVDAKTQDTSSTSLSLSGSIAANGDMAGPFSFESVNINFADLSDGRFMQFFNGKTTRERGARTLSAYIKLPLESSTPEFSGSFRLKDIRITAFPALRMVSEHLEPMRRKNYLPPVITEGTVELSHGEGAATLHIANGNAIEPEIISVRANVTISAENQLSGTLDYGIPAKLTHVEYPDGLCDPMFNDDGVYAWLATEVSGNASVPADNSAEVSAKAEPMRAERPGRISFDELDIDDFSVKMKARNSGKSPAADTSAPAAGSDSSNSLDVKVNNTESTKTPGESPSKGNLSLPTDDEFFPGLYH